MSSKKVKGFFRVLKEATKKKRGPQGGGPQRGGQGQGRGGGPQRGNMGVIPHGRPMVVRDKNPPKQLGVVPKGPRNVQGGNNIGRLIKGSNTRNTLK